MIRFVDLRGQIYSDDWPCFGFFDTTVDQFVGWEQNYVWDCWEDFKTDFEYFKGWQEVEIEGFLSLLGDWVPEK